MSHDKISAAARERMARTGEPYAAARRAVIREHDAASRVTESSPGTTNMYDTTGNMHDTTGNMHDTTGNMHDTTTTQGTAGAQDTTTTQGRQFFELKYRNEGLDRIGLVMDTIAGGGPGRSGAEVDANQIRIRVPGFNLDIPRECVQSAERSFANLHGTSGVHGGRGKWLVNGAQDGLVELILAPPCYTSRSLATLARRAPVRSLTLSLVDPDGFINQVS